MILQALYEYASRKKDTLPPEGFENKEIKFIIVIDKKGRFLELTDTREGNKGKIFQLPKAEGRSGTNSWKTAFLLWDHYGYVLKHPKEEDRQSEEMASKQMASFVNKIKGLPSEVIRDEGVQAVLSFYEAKEFESVKKANNWPDCARITGCNLTFGLERAQNLIAQRKAVVRYQASLTSKETEDEDTGDGNATEMVCLITGKRALPKRLHTATPIGGERNAKLVGFQKHSGYDSYGKEQAYNAPVSSEAESAYTRALAYLTTSENNRFITADMTVVFWGTESDSKYVMESDFGCFLGAPPKDDPDKGVKAVRNLFEAVKKGALPQDENDRFYVLGLSPNVARISVRFWKVGTVKQFAEKIIKHFEDLEIVKAPNDREYLTLGQLLAALVPKPKKNSEPRKIPSNLPDKVIKSILDGTPYPITLLQQCIRCIRADRRVTYARAALLKACLNRFRRFHKKNTKEVAVSLDSSNPDIGYLIGRLFAVLERIQEKAQPDINATIRDRYYGAASSNPITVFPQLLKLKNHHLVKLQPGDEAYKTYMEKKIGEIMDMITAFPAHLALNEQAQFAIGYYHQRQNFFSGKKTNE